MDFDPPLHEFLPTKEEEIKELAKEMNMTVEAVKEVIRYCFEELNLDFLACGHFVSNNQSRRVQEKCGFVHAKQVKHDCKDGSQIDCWISILKNENKGK